MLVVGVAEGFGEFNGVEEGAGGGGDGFGVGGLGVVLGHEVVDHFPELLLEAAAVFVGLGAFGGAFAAEEVAGALAEAGEFAGDGLDGAVEGFGDFVGGVAFGG